MNVITPAVPRTRRSNNDDDDNDDDDHERVDTISPIEIDQNNDNNDESSRVCGDMSMSTKKRITRFAFTGDGCYNHTHRSNSNSNSNSRSRIKNFLKRQWNENHHHHHHCIGTISIIRLVVLLWLWILQRQQQQQLLAVVCPLSRAMKNPTIMVFQTTTTRHQNGVVAFQTISLLPTSQRRPSSSPVQQSSSISSTYDTFGPSFRRSCRSTNVPLRWKTKRDDSASFGAVTSMITATSDSTVSTTNNDDSIRRKQPPQPNKTIGDHIYNRVKKFGKLVTFQASNPKNSKYFFGPTNNYMHHYYQSYNDTSTSTTTSSSSRNPSRRLFQMADDIDSIVPNRNNDNNNLRRHRRSASSNRIQSRKTENNSNNNSDAEYDDSVFQSNDSGGDDDDAATPRSFEQPAGDERQVWEALASLEKDMSLLDRMIGTKPQLSKLQLILFAGAVLSTACSPLFLAGQFTEFIAPSMAAFTAAIGIAAEYRGRVAVADSKEVAAASLQCAAEAEGYLAAAERAKAITPLCVGIGATAATLSLLVPVLVDNVFAGSTNLQLTTEIYLLCPLIAVLAAAVAGLAVQEVKSYCDTAIGIGNRRFARSGIVSRTWLSATEMIALKSKSSVTKWRSFSISVLPAPILGALCPGALPTKTIVVAALAAAGSAYYLARAEYVVARATDAVALKSRSAAVCDTYANQGARSAAILPFTSALSSLCAAATAAVVELPFVESLTGRFGTTGTMLEIITITVFPALSALFAAAASVSKARCEVDAEAAMQAASTIALPYNDTEDNDPIIRPLQAVRELIRLTIMNSVQEPVRRFLRGLNLRRRWRYMRRAIVRLQGR